MNAELKEQVITEARQEIQKQLIQDAGHHQSAWIADMVNHFAECCKDIRRQQLQGHKETVHYITYSLLRTALLDQHPVYLIQVTDEQWMLDRQPLEYEYEGHCIYGYWQQLIQHIIFKAGEAGWTISEIELDRIRLEEAEYFHKVMITLLRKAMKQATQLPECMELKRADQLEIRAGEYLDQTLSIYREDRQQLDEAEVRQWLGEKHSQTYGYQNLHDLNMQLMDCSELDFRYTSLRQVNISLSRFSFAVLTGTIWQNCTLDGASLAYSLVHGADFSGCSLRQVQMTGLRGAAGLAELDWEPLGWDGVNWSRADLTGSSLKQSSLCQAVFHQSILENTSFDGADLREADFRGAVLKGATFQNADLRGACLEDCNLTGVSFAGANLQGASLIGAILDGTDLTDTVYSPAQLSPLQQQSVIGFASDHGSAKGGIVH